MPAVVFDKETIVYEISQETGEYSGQFSSKSHEDVDQIIVIADPRTYWNGNIFRID